MKYKKLTLTCILILVVLSLSVSAADEKEVNFNNKYQAEIKNVKTDDDGVALSKIENLILKVSKEKKHDIYPETKYWFLKKYNEVRDTAKVDFLMVMSRKMELSKKEVQQLDPKKQEEVAIILKEAEGIGFRGFAGYSGVYVLLLAGVLLFMYRKYGVYIRGARNMDKFLRNAESLKHEEELNRHNMGKIEKRKEELIKENTKEADKLEKQEGRIERIDAKLRDGTKFTEGLHDKDLIRSSEDEIKKRLSLFFNGKGEEQDVDIIIAIVKRGGITAMRKLRSVILDIRQQNLKLHKLVIKEIKLDKEIWEELAKGKIEEERVKSIELDRLRSFIEKNKDIIKLEKKRDKFVDMIRKERGIEEIIKKGGKETLYVIEGFRESIGQLNKFNRNIGLQNSFLEAEARAIHAADLKEVIRAAEEIKKSFKEEKEFYRYINKKQEEQDIDVLEIFGKMKDVELLSNVFGTLADLIIKLGEMEEETNDEYYILEDIKGIMREKRLSPDIIAKVNEFQKKRAENQNRISMEREKMTHLEKMMYGTYVGLSGLSRIKDEGELRERTEKLIHPLDDVRAGMGDIERDLKPLRRKQKRTENLGKDIIEDIEAEIPQEEKEKYKGLIMRIRKRLGPS